MQKVTPFLAGALGITMFLTSLSSAQTETLKLNLKRPLELSLKGGELRRHQFQLEAGNFLHIVVRQKGIDIVLALYDPTGSKIAEVDSPNGNKGIEETWTVAKLSGEYVAEVRSESPSAKPAAYEITLAEQRPELADDAAFVQGTKLIAEAVPLLHGSNKLSDQGIAKLRQAEISFQELTDRPRKGMALRLLADTFYDTGAAEDALQLYDSAISYLEPDGSKKDLIEAYFYSARVSPDLRDRLSRSRRASVLAHDAGDDSREADSLLDVGNWARSLGDFQLSLKSYKQALAISRNQQDHGRAAVLLGNIGSVYRDMGDYPSSLNAQMESISVSQSSGAGPRPLSLLALGALYGELGEYELSREYTQKAIEVFRKSGDRDPLRVAISNLGHTYSDEGDFLKAFEYYQSALKLMTETKRYDPGIHCHIARAQKGIGNLGTSRLEALQCLDDFRRAGMRFREISTLVLLGEIELADRQVDKAVEYADAAFGKSVEFDYLGLQYSALSLRAESYLRQGKIEDANSAARSAIEILESLRNFVIGERGQQSFFSTRGTPFYVLVESAIRSGDYNAAWAAAERMKARNLVDLINARSRDISKGLTDGERAAETDLRSELVNLNRRLSEEAAKRTPNTQLVTSLHSRLDQTRLRMEELRTRLYAAHPELRSQRGEMNLASSDSAARLLTSKSVVLEYVVTPDRTFLITVTKDPSGHTSTKGYTIATDTKKLNSEVGAFTSTIASGNLGFTEAGQKLYDLLLKPAETELSGKTNLIIIPDGPLWSLPFGALQNENGNYLVERASVSYAPSLTALQEMRRKGADRLANRSGAAELVAFGNPLVHSETRQKVGKAFLNEKLDPLPEAERLVKGLGALYGKNNSRVYVGSAAGEKVAKSEAPKFRIVQFATHGILNNASPMYSHLVLARDPRDSDEDGLLEAWELKEMNLKADLVILSACETAGGRISTGEGVIGMTWAAFIAGAPATVSSQWKVESSSTTEFMLELHRQMISDKKISKSEALRRASLKLLQSSKYRHPFYWAPWILVGDGL